MEISIPVIAEDFEASDRVYLVSGGGVRYGTVQHVEKTFLNVKFDTGNEEIINLAIFEGTGYAGKCFPVSQLRIGSVISTVDSGKRYYASIMDLDGRGLVIQYHEGKGMYHLVESESDPLEFQMRDFELEG